MFVLIIYDSLYGNTARIAQTLADEANGHQSKAVAIGGVTPLEIMHADLLVIGSPTQGGHPTQSMQQYIDGLLSSWLLDKPVAAFDTRFAKQGHGPVLRAVMYIFGFAAPRIAETLVKKGAVLMLPPEGFIVSGKEGPLAPAETRHAADWMRQLLAAMPEDEDEPPEGVSLSSFSQHAHHMRKALKI